MMYLLGSHQRTFESVSIHFFCLYVSIHFKITFYPIQGYLIVLSKKAMIIRQEKNPGEELYKLRNSLLFILPCFSLVSVPEYMYESLNNYTDNSPILSVISVSF